MRVRPPYRITEDVIALAREMHALDRECLIDRCALCHKVVRVLPNANCVRCQFEIEAVRSDERRPALTLQLGAEARMLFRPTRRSRKRVPDTEVAHV